MDVLTLQALVPGISRAGGTVFFQRAAHYRSLSRALWPKTRFFAAAAWINDLLGALSSCGRLANPSETLLRTLGGRLLIENNRIARRIDAGILNAPPDALDRQLVQNEQLLVEEALSVQGKSSPDLCQAACVGIDALLNTAWLRRAAPLLPSPLCAISHLARKRSLTFASRTDREAIGLDILRCME